MSRRRLRPDQICKNCNEIVEKRFCGNCGQENTETRQSFGHLLRHFVEDLTHYDGAFWKTIKYLLLRPAFLTKEYLAGKRVSFVPPIRLYIFISFVTFLLPYVLPEPPDSVEYTSIRKERSDRIGRIDTLIEDISFNINYELVLLPTRYKTLDQLDSAQLRLPPSQRIGAVSRWINMKSFGMRQYSPMELGDKFFGSFMGNFPKVLFVFMPLFALVLWLFHGKKRWLYFDHAIFTLHYFSFILLVFNLLSVAEEFFFLGDAVGQNISVVIFLLLVIAVFIYFFIAHKKMYCETRLISFIYALNLIIFYFISVTAGLITLLNIH
ncbi:MAG: DUF3667 domain-containing protein [Bacteroidota bacterium]